MAEGITHSQKNTVLSYTEKHTVAAEQHEHKIPAHDGSTYSPSPPANEQTSIIWTPRFITTFFLVLVLGLSATSVFTQGYANSYFPGEWVLLAGCTLIFAMWTGTAVITKDLWARLGAVFGCVWILFVAANLVASLFAAPPRSRNHHTW